VVLGAADGARASSSSSGAFTLTWSAPDDCPSEAQVEADVERLVGGQLRLQDANDLHADVVVSGGPPWSAELTTRRADQLGHRSIEAPSCQAAVEAVALIIALSIDPETVAAAPAAPAPPVSSPRPPRSVWIVAGVHTEGRVGGLPEPDAGVGLGVGVTGRRWRALLRGTYGLRRDQVASLAAGASGRFNLVAGSLTGCMDVGRFRLAVGPCAVVEAGRASASGYGATAGWTREVPWVALGAGAFASASVTSHLHATIEVEALAPLYRPAYVFEDIPGVVFMAPPVGGRTLVELSWQF
jgi:hypothetical protein